jgi:hypothetical protein
VSRATRVAAGLVLLLCVVGLVGQALRGNAVVAHQRASTTVRNAQIDDAYYACLATQAHSLISPSTPVRYQPDATLLEVVLLNKSVASWITVAPEGTTPTALLGVVHTGGPSSCLGDVVIAKVRQADGHWVTRVGTGASLPGQGPPPAPPL